MFHFVSKDVCIYKNKNDLLYLKYTRFFYIWYKRLTSMLLPYEMDHEWIKCIVPSVVLDIQMIKQEVI